MKIKRSERIFYSRKLLIIRTILATMLLFKQLRYIISIDANVFVFKPYVYALSVKTFLGRSLVIFFTSENYGASILI